MEPDSPILIKNSGIGREGGWEAMRFFTEAKNVTFGT